MAAERERRTRPYVVRSIAGSALTWPSKLIRIAEPWHAALGLLEVAKEHEHEDEAKVQLRIRSGSWRCERSRWASSSANGPSRPTCDQPERSAEMDRE
jgi:hypothetical protein